MNVSLGIFKHKQANQIAIRFPYDLAIKETIKKIEGVKWTQTHKTFYMSFSVQNYAVLLQVLQEKNIQIRANTVLEYLPKQKPVVNNVVIKTLYAFGSWMRQKRYSENTISTYCGLLDVFYKFYSQKKVSEITKKDIIHFNTNYIIANNYSANYQNQLINALKLFYRKYNDSFLELEDLERPKRAKYLPNVLSLEEVEQLLNNVSNLKHKTLLCMVYSAGLRIGECLNLKLQDVDSKRMLIHVKNAKGQKDRYIPLSENILLLLRMYYKIYRPKDFLFEGKYGGAYSQSSCRSILNQAKRKTSIKKRITLHTLRHSYATHLLESGTDIRYIQQILGHNDPKTTMIYTHVSTNSIKNIKSPFDKLKI